MKKSVLFLLFLLVLPFAYSSDWIYNSENIIVDLEMGGKIDVVPKTSKYSLQYVITNLSFVPQDGFQEEILSLETNPSADVRDRTIIYRWDDPTGTELEYGLKSSIRSFNKFVKVKKKISFPLDDILDDIKVYTKPSETIDSDNEAIIKKASEIIEGEDDLYVVVFKLGEWTKNNVKYDLSTLTAKATQKASWVLGTKEGVCDELTNLFIAMNRALGIPAKFISGMAYTNAEEFEEGFGTHGWAEVYFPDYGWVPFDVTYGEFGFVDASHIKLKESVDANDASTKYQWLGKDISLKTNPLDIKAELKDTSGEIDELIDISAKAVKGEVGFGSYNLVEASVENLNNHYVATTLFLSKTREVELIDKEEKYLLLKPNEERKVSW
ncbi:MAG: transglutaminase-like domain-containing protein, partial [Nanoarchaeota archaeon]|nr:transglutaminase-like domain-containing protein [Nanoarchaeota archaeon]